MWNTDEKGDSTIIELKQLLCRRVAEAVGNGHIIKMKKRKTKTKKNAMEMRTSNKHTVAALFIIKI